MSRYLRSVASVAPLTWFAERHVDTKRIMYRAMKAIPTGTTNFTNSNKLAPITTRVLNVLSCLECQIRLSCALTAEAVRRP